MNYIATDWCIVDVILVDVLVDYCIVVIDALVDVGTVMAIASGPRSDVIVKLFFAVLG